MSSDRRLVQLDNRYPGLSRMTLFRIAREPDFPTPIIIRNRRYYDDAELTAWEESRRRIKRERKAANAAESTPQ
jgi:predicted DNA-binding transcriptional regulator AlpA